jgi:hypothetical protein
MLSRPLASGWLSNLLRFIFPLVVACYKPYHVNWAGMTRDLPSIWIASEERTLSPELTQISLGGGIIYWVPRDVCRTGLPNVPRKKSQCFSSGVYPCRIYTYRKILH